MLISETVFNLFVNAELDENGCYNIVPPTALKGDYIDLLAEMDILAGISNCPSDMAVNDYSTKPLGGLCCKSARYRKSLVPVAKVYAAWWAPDSPTSAPSSPTGKRTSGFKIILKPANEMSSVSDVSRLALTGC